MQNLLAILILILNFGSAFGQAPPPIPALPDIERRVSYSLTAQAGPLNIPFALYGDGTDYGSWVEVYLNGVLVNPATYALTSPSGTLSTLPRPITNAQVTFVTAQTGVVQIIGARRPRRTSQFNENVGVSARSINQVETDNVATARERWDEMSRVPRAPAGDVFSTLPPVSVRKNLLLGFNNNGDLALFSPTGATPPPPVMFGDIHVGSILSSAPQNLTVAPTGNTIPTLSSFSMQATTVSNPQREFLMNLGLVDNITMASLGADKVTLYAGCVAAANTPVNADLWCINTVLELGPNSGNGYNAQGYELDFNNLNAHRGEALAGFGVGAPVAWAFSITGASTFRSTGAMLIGGSVIPNPFGDGVTNATATFTSATANFQPGDVGKSIIIPGAGVAGSRLVTTIAARASTTSITLSAAASNTASNQVFYLGVAQWNRGITIVNAVQQVSFLDIGFAETSIDIKNSHLIGIDLSEGIFTTAAIRLPNNTPIEARNVAGTLFYNIAYVDQADVYQIGGGLPVHVGAVLPATSITSGSLTVAGGLGVTQAGYFGAEVRTGFALIANLPACDAAHTAARHFVIDANLTTFFSPAVTGGINHVPVFCDGAVWRIG